MSVFVPLRHLFRFSLKIDHRLQQPLCSRSAADGAVEGGGGSCGGLCVFGGGGGAGVVAHQFMVCKSVIYV